MADGLAYDAELHAIFLGFVMSMIFAHAPVIVPSVLGRPLPYRPALYVPLALLHASLVLRLAGGDWAGSTDAWQWGGSLNEVAILLFLIMVADPGDPQSAHRTPPPRRTTAASARAAAAGGHARPSAPPGRGRSPAA